MKGLVCKVYGYVALDGNKSDAKPLILKRFQENLKRNIFLLLRLSTNAV
jgi:hypothetical protein